MKIRPGNTYKISATIDVGEGDFDINQFEKIVFKMGGLVKVWTQDESGEVTYLQDGAFLIKLSQQETFQFDRPVQTQSMLYFRDGTTRQTEIITSALKPTIFTPKDL